MHLKHKNNYKALTLAHCKISTKVSIDPLQLRPLKYSSSYVFFLTDLKQHNTIKIDLWLLKDFTNNIPNSNGRSTCNLGNMLTIVLFYLTSSESKTSCISSAGEVGDPKQLNWEPVIDSEKSNLLLYPLVSSFVDL